MKRIFIILILCSGIANAQDVINPENSSKEISTPTEMRLQSNEVINNRLGATEDIENDTVCYAETSKIAFFEILISKNDFDISLKHSNKIAIKSTEEMISKLKKRTLLASAE